MPAGRPTDYRPEYAEQAKKLCNLGATNQDLAEFFDCNIMSIYRWQAKFPEFGDALKIGKGQGDERVVRSLYQKAVGYHLPVKKVVADKDGNLIDIEYTEYMPPDTTSCIFWLKNRRPDEWRDKREVEQSGEGFSLTINEKPK